jgi:hypothetical protein
MAHMSLPVKIGGELSRSDQQRWQDWAKTLQWQFTSYYKYTFVFTAKGTAPSPPDGAPAEFTATMAVGRDASDIYRYPVETAPMTWDEVIAGGDWKLTVTTADGSFAYACCTY